MVLIFTLAYKF